MARTKQFDRDAVLQKALEMFWERGYEATSMADLVERLGIAREHLRDLRRKARALPQGVPTLRPES